MEANCIAATSQRLTKKEALSDVGMFTVVPYKANKMKNELRHERKIMYQLRFVETLKYFIYIKLKMIKQSLKA